MIIVDWYVWCSGVCFISYGYDDWDGLCGMLSVMIVMVESISIVVMRKVVLFMLWLVFYVSVCEVSSGLFVVVIEFMLLILFCSVFWWLVLIIFDSVLFIVG